MHPTEPKPLAVSLTKAAELLDVGRRTMERYTADGRIRTIRIGRSVRVPYAEIERLLKDGAP